jgi:hypothetical protein
MVPMSMKSIVSLGFTPIATEILQYVECRAYLAIVNYCALLAFRAGSANLDSGIGGVSA